MTASHRSVLRSAALITALSGLFVMAMSWLADIAYAASQPDSALPDSNDAQGWVQALYEFVTKGAHVPAVGAFLVIVVWLLRLGATRIPWLGIGAWFATTIGGYVLGFGTAALLDFGLALAAGGVFSWGLIGVAVGHGYASSGGWEHLRDVLGYLGRKPVVGASAAASFAVVCIAASCSGCPGSGITGDGVKKDAISCLEDNSGQMAALAAQLGCKFVGGVVSECDGLSGDWGQIESAAERAGAQIGGCVLAELVQSFLSRPRATQVDQTWQARDALERFRTKLAHGATFKTPVGDL
jgi:hypothetical protein